MLERLRRVLVLVERLIMSDDHVPYPPAVERLVNAEIADSWSGGGDPNDVPAVELELAQARHAFYEWLQARDEPNVVELSTGHVFAKGSVRAVSAPGERDGCPMVEIIGVGFSVKVYGPRVHARADLCVRCDADEDVARSIALSEDIDAAKKALHAECVEKLLR